MAHHPDWSEQEKYNLADYEDENDEERGPGVPRHIPIGLRELLSKRSIGLDKPWEVQGASHLDPVQDEGSKTEQVVTSLSKCSLQQAIPADQPDLRKAVQELEKKVAGSSSKPDGPGWKDNQQLGCRANREDVLLLRLCRRL